MNPKHKHTILLVDDEKTMLELLCQQLQEDYNILTALSGEKALEILQMDNQSVSLIISDQNMPKMTGSQFLEKAKEISPDSIRFLITGYTDMNAIIEALNKGEINRYLTKPIDHDELLIEVKNAVEQFDLIAENRNLLILANQKNEELEKKVVERSKDLIEKYEQLKASRVEIDKVFEDTIHLISKLVDMVNPELGTYMKHTGRLSRKTAEAYGLEEHMLKQIEVSGLFHDLGLLGLPELIFSKDEIAMDETEYGLYAQHPSIAAMSCNHIPKLKWVASNIQSHHEHYDGSGYPEGLKGDEIPIGARIVAAVSDYCRIIDIWPRDLEKIKLRFEENFGPGSADSFDAQNTEDLLCQAAEKVLDLGKENKYDPDVVEKLKQQINQEKQAEKNSRWLDINDLKEGMVLEKQLRLKDGKPLLSKGLVFNESSINSLKKLKKLGKIDHQVYIMNVL